MRHTITLHLGLRQPITMTNRIQTPKQDAGFSCVTGVEGFTYSLNGDRETIWQTRERIRIKKEKCAETKKTIMHYLKESPNRQLRYNSKP